MQAWTSRGSEVTKQTGSTITHRLPSLYTFPSDWKVRSITPNRQKEKVEISLSHTSPWRRGVAENPHAHGANFSGPDQRGLLGGSEHSFTAVTPRGDPGSVPVRGSREYVRLTGYEVDPSGRSSRRFIEGLVPGYGCRTVTS